MKLCEGEVPHAPWNYKYNYIWLTETCRNPAGTLHWTILQWLITPVATILHLFSLVFLDETMTNIFYSSESNDSMCGNPSMHGWNGLIIRACFFCLPFMINYLCKDVSSLYFDMLCIIIRSSSVRMSALSPMKHFNGPPFFMASWTVIRTVGVLLIF